MAGIEVLEETSERLRIGGSGFFGTWFGFVFCLGMSLAIVVLPLKACVENSVAGCTISSFAIVLLVAAFPLLIAAFLGLARGLQGCQFDHTSGTVTITERSILRGARQVSYPLSDIAQVTVDYWMSTVGDDMTPHYDVKLCLRSGKKVSVGTCYSKRPADSIAYSIQYFLDGRAVPNM